MPRSASWIPSVSLLLLAACQGGDKSSPTDTGAHSQPTTTNPHSTVADHTGTGTTPPESGTNPTDSGLPPGLHGTPPAVAKGPPTFSHVVSRTGNPVAPGDLLGHPTVLWFYPAAATGG